MLGILLVIDLIAIALTVYLVRGQRDHLRESVLIGFVFWGTGVLVSTELISLFHALGFWEILLFWIVVLALCISVILKHWDGVKVIGAGNTRPWPFLEKVSFNRIVFFSVCLGIIALLAPPNTYDAMSYHMSRVMHWIQDRSVTYYPTNISLQLIYPNFAEYVILHFQLLSGTDRWANAVQWLSMCGSLIGVSLIAKEIGAGRRGQILSSLIAVTIPMGVLQATSTQTDYVDTLWLCAIVYFFLRWRQTLGGGYALLVAASIGLDLTTKGLVLIYALPFLGWMLIAALRRMKIKKLLMMGLAVVCVAGLFYSGILYRNTVYFHGQAAKFASVNDSLFSNRICWEGFVANVLRNTGLHLSTPWANVNAAIENGIYGTASFLHLDLNNKDWSFAGLSFKVLSLRSDEDMTGNLLHLFLFSVVTVLFFISSRFRTREATFYWVACFLGWIIFNAILKWQPWHSRFHLGIFVIFAPFAGLVIERIRIRWIVSGIMGALFLSAWVFLFLNVSKQICSSMSIFNQQNRPGLYFIRAQDPQGTFLKYELIAHALKKIGCKKIGLIMSPYVIEYFLWTTLNPSSDHSMRIESVLVTNASAALKYPLGDFVPDAIVAFDDDRSWVNWENNIYQVVWHDQTEDKKFSILMKAP